MADETEKKPDHFTKGWKIGSGIIVVAGVVVAIYMSMDSLKSDSYKEGLKDKSNKKTTDPNDTLIGNIDLGDGKRTGRNPSKSFTNNSTNPSQIILQNTNADLDFYKEKLDEYSNKYLFCLEMYHSELKNNKKLIGRISEIEIELDYAKRVKDQLFLEKDPIRVEELKKELDEAFDKIDASLNELAPSQWNDYQPKKADTIRITTIVKVVDEEKRGDDAIETARNHTEILKHDSDSNLFKRFKKKTKKEIVEQTLQEYNNALNFYKSAGAQSKIGSTENEIKKFILDFSKYLNK